jgi:hypothetical protein
LGKLKQYRRGDSRITPTTTSKHIAFTTIFLSIFNHQPMHLTILYRGPLNSCNYGCEYCPFAKQSANVSQLAQDRAALERFTRWIAGQTNDEFSILFTPWGEALIYDWYQAALTELSHQPNVKKVAIQTNLSADLNWVKGANPQTLAFWATFHPEWVSRPDFLRQCQILDDCQFKFSVGVVGFAKFKADIAALRQELPPHIYLWINSLIPVDSSRHSK